MSIHNTFSLSMQKQISQQNVVIGSETDRAFNDLKFKSMLHGSGIRNAKGYEPIRLLFLLVLLPFLKCSLMAFQTRGYLENLTTARKDTFYRFLNHERYNWRKSACQIAIRIIARSDPVPLREKTLLADDTIAEKTGRHMELVSYYSDHKTKRSV